MKKQNKNFKTFLITMTYFSAFSLLVAGNRRISLNLMTLSCWVVLFLGK